MTQEELEARVVEFSKTLESIKGQVEGGEKLIQQHKTEIGDARKEIKQFVEDFKGTVGDKEKLKKVLDGYDELVKTIGQSTSKIDQGKTQDPAKEKEIVLTEEQKRKADEVFKALPPDQKVAIKSDPEHRRKFLEAAIEAAPKVPESLFDDEPEPKETAVNEFRKLFGLANKESSFVPGSKRGASDGFADAGGKKTIFGGQKIVGGIIPRPTQKT